jgi:cytochrome c553
MPLFSRALFGGLLILLPTPGGAQTVTPPRLILICAPCHGFDGVGHDGTVPNLAGQNRDYILRQLLAFRSGQRPHPAMGFFSGQATRDELEEIVDYYSSLPRRQ